MQPTVRQRPASWSPEPDDRPAGVDPSAVAAAMDRIRSHVHRWIDQVEALARAAQEDDREAEAQRLALREEIERHRREWEAGVEALDHDRRLLAEAWERIEREQAAALASPRPADDPTPPHRPAAPPPTVAVAPRSAEPDGMVDKAILRQFEALRRDVRRTAESRGPSAP